MKCFLTNYLCKIFCISFIKYLDCLKKKKTKIYQFFYYIYIFVHSIKIYYNFFISKKSKTPFYDKKNQKRKYFITFYKF